MVASRAHDGANHGERQRPGTGCSLATPAREKLSRHGPWPILASAKDMRNAQRLARLGPPAALVVGTFSTAFEPEGSEDDAIRPLGPRLAFRRLRRSDGACRAPASRRRRHLAKGASRGRYHELGARSARSTPRACAVPPVADVVRMANMRAHYHFHVLSPQRVAVEYQVEVDPGGALPEWLKWLSRRTWPTTRWEDCETGRSSPEPTPSTMRVPASLRGWRSGITS